MRVICSAVRLPLRFLRWHSFWFTLSFSAPNLFPAKCSTLLPKSESKLTFLCHIFRSLSVSNIFHFDLELDERRHCTNVLESSVARCSGTLYTFSLLNSETNARTTCSEVFFVLYMRVFFCSSPFDVCSSVCVFFWQITYLLIFSLFYFNFVFFVQRELRPIFVCAANLSSFWRCACAECNSLGTWDDQWSRCFFSICTEHTDELTWYDDNNPCIDCIKCNNEWWHLRHTN